MKLCAERRLILQSATQTIRCLQSRQIACMNYCLIKEIDLNMQVLSLRTSYQSTSTETCLSLRTACTSLSHMSMRISIPRSILTACSKSFSVTSPGERTSRLLVATQQILPRCKHEGIYDICPRHCILCAIDTVVMYALCQDWHSKWGRLL